MMTCSPQDVSWSLNCNPFPLSKHFIFALSSFTFQFQFLPFRNDRKWWVEITFGNATLRHQINWFSTRFPMYKNHLHIIQNFYCCGNNNRWKILFMRVGKDPFPRKDLQTILLYFESKIYKFEVMGKKLAFKWEKGFDSWSYKKTSITIESILGREGRKWRKMILFYCLSLPQKFLSNVFENYHNFLCFFKTNKNSTILSYSHMRRFVTKRLNYQLVAQTTQF